MGGGTLEVLGRILLTNAISTMMFLNRGTLHRRPCYFSNALAHPIDPCDLRESIMPSPGDGKHRDNRKHGKYK